MRIVANKNLKVEEDEIFGTIRDGVVFFQGKEVSHGVDPFDHADGFGNACARF